MSDCLVLFRINTVWHRVKLTNYFFMFNLEVPNNDEAHGNKEDSSSERKTRSQIDRIIPLPESGW